ncbi:MAG: hypothetical protein JKY19_00455 [Alcanivoracaceae bacterium]|nr:hypothetical protein [Alcanivoracaceae bacterium]
MLSQKIKEGYWEFRKLANKLSYWFRDYGYQLIIFNKIVQAATKGASSNYPREDNALIFISYYSPPYISAYGTQRLSKFIKYWNLLDQKIILLTTVPPSGEREANPTNMDKIENYCQAVRIPLVEIRNLTERKSGYAPDKYIGWIDKAVNKADEIIALSKPRAIIATVPPYSNAVAAYLISKAHDIPLILDFRDPWSKIDHAWIINNRFLRCISAFMEYIVLRSATLILIADDKHHLPQYLVKGDRWRHKTVTITNGYDEEQFDDGQLTANEDGFFKISYVGSIYGQETLDNLLAPLLLWHQDHPEDLKQVIFFYAGSSALVTKASFDFIHDVVIKGFLSHQDSINLRYKSNLQFFTLPSYIKDHIYTGKIFEMIRTPVPILAICRPNSAPAELIRRTNTGVIFTNKQVPETALCLKRQFDKWKNGIDDYSPNTCEITKYERKILAEKALRSIDTAIDQCVYLE